MKNAAALLIILEFLSLDTFAQTYGLDNTNPDVFSMFRIPNSNLNSIWFNTNLYGSSYRNSNLYVTGPNYNSTGAYVMYSLSPRYYMLRESDDRYLSLTSYLTGSYSYSDGRSEGPGVPSANFHKDVSDGLSLTVAGSLRNYAIESNLFYSVSSDIDVELSDEHNVYPQSDSIEISYYNGTKSQVYDFSIGLGWGKMRNVTSLVSAIRFQERMKQLNLINSDLGEQTIEDLAQEFYRQGYYSSVHVRPDKFFWGDLEKILSNDGVVLTGLNQYADSYLREVPNELRFMRVEGAMAGLNLQFRYTNDYYSAYYQPPGGYIRENFFTLGNAYLSYSHQLNLNSQLAFSLSTYAGPNLTKNSDTKQMYEVDNTLGYSYELTDRFVAVASNSFKLVYQNSKSQDRILSNETNLNLNYFVEDNISLSASYTLSYNDMKEYYVIGHERQVYNSLTVGFTYYIQRGLLYN